jgi:hypothetical protein
VPPERLGWAERPHTACCCRLLLLLLLRATPDPPGQQMYIEIGKTKRGLTKWRSTRGSSKNEAANLVLEHSMHTTAPMNEDTAAG